MKLWAIILLFALPVSVWADGNEADKTIDEKPITWVDSSHSYATDQSQALTQWMDNFFGDPINDSERAESFLRAQLIDDWDGEGGHNFKARLRGKVQLPKISKRLDLVFLGEDTDDALSREERDEDDSLGLQYELAEKKHSRFDLTLGISRSGLRPGLRFRNSNAFGERSSYRFRQRVQHENDEGFYSTTQLDLYRTIGEDDSLRWSNRLRYGDETEGKEWRTSLSLRQRYLIDTTRPIATSAYVSIDGVTEPKSFTKNYRLGFLFRRQVYRDFLFIELEPAYNYRRRDVNEQRHGVWSIVFRFEIAFEKDLRREKKNNQNKDQAT